jgi:hypothetical protein
MPDVPRSTARTANGRELEAFERRSLPTPNSPPSPYIPSHRPTNGRPRAYGFNLGAGGCERVVILPGGCWRLYEDTGFWDRVTRQDAADVLRGLRKEQVEIVRIPPGKE